MDVEIIEDDYKDVEIIEEEECEVIEISSDEEDSKNFVTNENVYEIPSEVNVVREQSQLTTNTRNLNKTICSNDCRPLENNAGGAVTEIVEVVHIKQENTVNSDNTRNRSGENIARETNITVTNPISACKNNTKNKRRNRNRPSRRNHLAANESDNFNNDLNGSVRSDLGDQASSSTRNKNIPTSYDVSKLKWLRPLNNLSSPPHLQIVIIDRSHKYWRIENHKWLMVEKRLLEALNRELLKNNDLSIGCFDGAKWQRGIKVIGCHNENAFNFILKFIINLDKLWHGAKLDALPMSCMSRHIVKGYIPPPTIKTELIFSLIKLQNPLLCSDDWRVVKEQERRNNGGIDIWISVNDQSFMQLSNIRGEIKYGINRIFLNPC